MIAATSQSGRESELQQQHPVWEAQGTYGRQCSIFRSGQLGMTMLSTIGGSKAGRQSQVVTATFKPLESGFSL